VRRPAVGDRLTAALDDVLEAEARAAQTDAARADDEPVVEARRLQVAGVRLEHERLDALLAQPRIAARDLLEVVDAGDLEPDEVLRVVDDPLRVGLGEAHAHRRGRGERLGAVGTHGGSS